LKGANIACRFSYVFIAFAKSIFSLSSTKGEIQKTCLHFSISLLTKSSICCLSSSVLATLVNISFLPFGYSEITDKSWSQYNVKAKVLGIGVAVIFKL
jgi:hypothetical protein